MPLQEQNIDRFQYNTKPSLLLTSTTKLKYPNRWHENRCLSSNKKCRASCQREHHATIPPKRRRPDMARTLQEQRRDTPSAFQSHEDMDIRAADGSSEQLKLPRIDLDAMTLKRYPYKLLCQWRNTRQDHPQLTSGSSFRQTCRRLPAPSSEYLFSPKNSAHPTQIVEDKDCQQHTDAPQPIRSPPSHPTATSDNHRVGKCLSQTSDLSEPRGGPQALHDARKTTRRDASNRESPSRLQEPGMERREIRVQDNFGAIFSNRGCRLTTA